MDLYSTADICRAVARSAREARLRMDLSRAGLSRRSGVPEASIVRFERTGEVSLRSLVGIAIALSAESEFFRLFAAAETPTIDEIAGRRQRQRGRQ